MKSKASPLFFVMGVSACGKTTLGRELARQLHIPFFDADHFHPPANIAKMSKGIPLDDTDRVGWLERLNEIARKAADADGAVIACSALKEKYRQSLMKDLDANRVQWIVLEGTFEDILERIQGRHDHYMPPMLLESQFETLELPDYGIHLKAYSQDVEGMVGEIRSRTGS